MKEQSDQAPVVMDLGCCTGNKKKERKRERKREREREREREKERKRIVNQKGYLVLEFFFFFREIETFLLRGFCLLKK